MNESYTVTVFRNFTNGTNFLTAFVNNSQNSPSKPVVFSVVLPAPPENNQTGNQTNNQTGN
ncbi:hypothetical protein HYV50_01800 [Candidatus Pacearchaeota archaeon]|nr:hypothetical protein [Candidatus Pacearchaeota archaeon]